MILYLIRHGEMAGDPHALMRPPVKGCLTARGKTQARSLAAAFRPVALHRIVASPLGRALETAQTLANQKKLPIEPAPWLVEWRLGSKYRRMESARFEAIVERLSGFRREQTWKCAIGESILQMADRIVTGFHDFLETEGVVAGHGGYLLEKRAEDRAIALVAHGGSLGLLARFLLSAPIEPGPCVAFEHTGVACFRFLKQVDVYYPMLVIPSPELPVISG